MIILIILIAIVIGFIIAKYYKPKSKSEKIWASILIPLVSGILIHLLVAACRNSGYGFAFDLGATIVWMAIPEVFLLITLFIKLKPDDKKSINIESQIKDETFGVPLHYGTGENRVDFELQLTKKEILKIAELRRQDPDKWEDNDLELVKAVKSLLQEETENYFDANGTHNNEEVAVNVDGLKSDVESVEKPLVEEMVADEPISSETTEKIAEEVASAVASESVKEPVIEEQSVNDFQPVTSVVEKTPGIFGGKLESEYRRESVTDAHWIRQNGTEMCINIDAVTYQRMIELQNENPKKWVDNEFNLYLEAKSGKQSGCKRKRTWKMKRWMWVLAGIIGLCVVYGVVAKVVDNTVTTCSEDAMQRLYYVLKNAEYVDCDYPTFRYRMIANSLYRKKMYNLYPYYPYKWKGQWNDKKCDYDDYVLHLHRDKWIENPFVWIW